MAKKKSNYRCSHCGYSSAGYFSKCPSCGSWNTLELEEESSHSRSGTKRSVKTKRLREVEGTGKRRFSTSYTEFDRVMGGGILVDGVTILAAKPGAGKSTLLFQIANDLGNRGLSVLYASGEESESQIKERAQRISEEISENVWIYAGNSMDDVLSQIHELDVDAIILDSIQTFTLEEFPARAGSPTQTMECAHALVEEAKNPNRPRMVFFVGQLTKTESLAGVRALEHLVDTVLFIDHEMNGELRVLMATKNRFGSTGEMGFFHMDENGMTSIDNPSEYFMTVRESGEEVSGSALSIVREGTRPVIVEVESLVSKSYGAYPQRISECLRRDQLGILLSILEERAQIPFYEKNVVLKTTGGIKLKENASNLAVLMSIASAIKNRPIDNGTLFIGDVGLTGEIKTVPSMEARIKEASRMGYRTLYTGKLPEKIKEKEYGKLKIVEKRTLIEVIREVL